MLAELTDIARRAGEAVVAARAAGLERRIKNGAELVTSADLASHGVIEPALQRRWPHLPRVMEEGGGAPPASGAFIVVDELDGTVPFSCGFDGWAVMLALVDGQGPALAVVHLPERAATLTAVRGGGCTLNGRALRMPAAPAGLGDALLGSELNRMLDEQDWLMQARLTRASRGTRCIGCTGASVLELLQGRTQAYVNLRGGRIWDFAPVALLIEEAGGAVATPDGGPLRWNEIWMRFAAAASGTLLQELLALGRRC